MIGSAALSAPALSQPASRSFVTSDGVRLHWLEAGRGRPIVFVPGWTMPAEIWDAQLAHFSAGHRAIAFDPRSQGRSATAPGGHTAERRAEDIAEFLDRLGPEPAVLVGWSLGAIEVIVHLARRGDARVAGLVLVDNSVGEEPPPAFGLVDAQALRRDRVAATRAFVRAMYARPQPAAYIERIVGASLRTPFEASLQLLAYPHPRTFYRDALYASSRPLLYLVTPRLAAQAANVRRNRPGTEIEVFEGAGHALFVDDPERFNRRVERFVREKVAR